VHATDLFVIELVRWWCHENEGEFSKFLAEDFVYDNGLEAVNREDFLLIRAGSGAIEDLKIIGVQCCKNAVSVMFEGADSVTYLRHRVCWMVTLDGDCVKRIAACVGNVLRAEERLVPK